MDLPLNIPKPGTTLPHTVLKSNGISLYYNSKGVLYIEEDHIAVYPATKAIAKLLGLNLSVNIESKVRE